MERRGLSDIGKPAFETLTGNFLQIGIRTNPLQPTPYRLATNRPHLQHLSFLSHSIGSEPIIEAGIKLKMINFHKYFFLVWTECFALIFSVPLESSGRGITESDGTRGLPQSSFDIGANHEVEGFRGSQTEIPQGIFFDPKISKDEEASSDGENFVVDSRIKPSKTIKRQMSADIEDFHFGALNREDSNSVEGKQEVQIRKEILSANTKGGQVMGRSIGFLGFSKEELTKTFSGWKKGINLGSEGYFKHIQNNERYDHQENLFKNTEENREKKQQTDHPSISGNEKSDQKNYDSFEKKPETGLNFFQNNPQKHQKDILVKVDNFTENNGDNQDFKYSNHGEFTNNNHNGYEYIRNEYEGKNSQIKRNDHFPEEYTEPHEVRNLESGEYSGTPNIHKDDDLENNELQNNEKKNEDKDNTDKKSSKKKSIEKENTDNFGEMQEYIEREKEHDIIENNNHNQDQKNKKNRVEEEKKNSGTAESKFGENKEKPEEKIQQNVLIQKKMMLKTFHLVLDKKFGIENKHQSDFELWISKKLGYKVESSSFFTIESIISHYLEWVEGNSKRPHYFKKVYQMPEKLREIGIENTKKEFMKGMEFISLQEMIEIMHPELTKAESSEFHNYCEKFGQDQWGLKEGVNLWDSSEFHDLFMKWKKENKSLKFHLFNFPGRLQRYINKIFNQFVDFMKKIFSNKKGTKIQNL